MFTCEHKENSRVIRMVLYSTSHVDIICHHVLKNKYPDPYIRHSEALDRSEYWQLSNHDLELLCKSSGEIHRSVMNSPYRRRKKRSPEKGNAINIDKSTEKGIPEINDSA